mgnify:CR=1 FL=1
MCDVFVRRNTNRSQMQEMERGEYIIADVFTANIEWVEGIESASAEYFE